MNSTEKTLKGVSHKNHQGQNVVSGEKMFFEDRSVSLFLNFLSGAISTSAYNDFASNAVQ
jgi:hypothetical protein